MKMKQKTKDQLLKLANHLVDIIGDDARHLTTWQILKKSKELKLSFSYQTIENYKNYLDKVIIDKSNKGGLEKILLNQAPNLPVPQQDNNIKPPKTIKLTIAGGVWEYQLVDIVEPQQVEKVPMVFFGLFNYETENIISIRRGIYNGCNVKDKNSILQHFGSLTWFKQWCEGRLDDVKNPEFKRNADTDRDIETLERLLKSITRLTSNKMI